DDRATRFAEKFYDALVRGEPVPAAVAVARLFLKGHGFLPQAANDRGDLQDPTYVLPQLYCRVPVERLLDPDLAPKPAPVPQTRYHELGGGILGMKTGFIGRRREQQQLLPRLKSGDYICLVLHGPGGQGKSTLVTRLVNRLEPFGYRVLAIKSVQQKGESPGRCGARTSSQLLSELHRQAVLAEDDQLAKILSKDGVTTEMKLSFAADELNRWKLLLVLDNWEDVLDLETLQIVDPALAAFYERVTNNLVDGSRVFFTTRYIPHGTPENLTHCHVRESLPDFTEAEFLKFLRCDETLLNRLGKGELSRELLHRLFQAAGGTPRFLGQIRIILKSISSA
ncbi:MAG: AAA family ATPase, partial [Schlesneria sp.]